MLESNVLIIFLLVLMIFSLTSVTMSFYLNIREKRKRQSYNEMNKRYSVESKLYDLEKQLLKMEYEKQKNLNNIILEGQKNIFEPSFKNIFEKNITIDPKLVLYLTPFMDFKSFEDASEQVKLTVTDIGLTFVRSDEEFTENIMPHIVELIKKAAIIVVNIDGRNPNVFYELGIAHTLKKDVIIITREIENIPFDIRDKRILYYENYSELDHNLRKNIIRILTYKNDY